MKKLLAGFGLLMALGPLAFSQADERGAKALSRLPVIDFAIPRQTSETASLTERMKSYRTPGVSVALIDGNTIRWVHSAGVLKAGNPAPVREASLFEAGSVSKFVLYLEILAGLAREYGWPSGQPFQRGE